MRRNLFRGQNATVWMRRLTAAGWPGPFASEMAAFLVGDLRPTPLWPGMVAGSDPDHSRMARATEDQALVDKWFEPPELNG